MKTCFKCHEVKPLSEFYAHPLMRDGHVNKCKTCNKADVIKHRKENDSTREYDRRRAKTEKGKAAIAAAAKKWRAANPEKYKAQTTLNNAVRAGRVTRQPCRICGDHKSHAHHEDYSKPLEVDWLCAKHHQRHHHQK